MEELLQRVPSASSPPALVAQAQDGTSPRVNGIVLPTPHPGTEWLRSAIPERGTMLLKERRNWTSAQRRELVRSMQAAVEARNQRFRNAPAAEPLRSGSRELPQRHTDDGNDGVESTRKPEVLCLERSVLQRGVIRSDLMLPPSQSAVTLAHLLKHRRIAPPLHQQIVSDAGGEGMMRLLEDMALPLKPEEGGLRVHATTECAMPGHSELPWWPDRTQQQQPQGRPGHAQNMRPHGNVAERNSSPPGLPRTKLSSSQCNHRATVPISVSWTQGRTGTPELRVLPFDDLFQLAGIAHAATGGAAGSLSLHRQINGTSDGDDDYDMDDDDPAIEITRSRDVGLPSSPTRTDRSIGLHYGELGESSRVAPFATSLALRLSPVSPEGGDRRLPESSLVAEASSPLHGCGAVMNRSTAVGTDGSPAPSHTRRRGGDAGGLRRRESEASLPRQRLLLKKMETLITAGKDQIRPERLYEKHGGMSGREFTLSNASHRGVLSGAGFVRSPDPIEVSAAEELVSLLTNRERRRRHLQGRRLLKPVCNRAAGSHADRGPDTYNPIPEEERRRCDQAWLDNPDYWFLQEATIEDASNETKRLREQGHSFRGREGVAGRYEALSTAGSEVAATPNVGLVGLEVGLWSSPIVVAPGGRRRSPEGSEAAGTPLKTPLAPGQTPLRSSDSPGPLDDIAVEWTTSGPVLRSESEMKHATVLREKQLIHERYEAIKRRDMAILRERQERLHHQDILSPVNRHQNDRADSLRSCSPVGERGILAAAGAAAASDSEGVVAVAFSAPDCEPQHQANRSGKARIDVLSAPRLRSRGSKSLMGSAERQNGRSSSSYMDYLAERQHDAEVHAQQMAAVRTVAIPVFMNIKAFA